VPPFIVSMASMNIAKGVASVFTKTQSVSWPRNTDAGGWFRNLAKAGPVPTGLIIFLIAAAICSDEASANIVIEVAVPAQTTVDLCSTEASKIMSKSDTIGIFGSNQTSAEGVLAANNNLGVLNSDPSKGMIGIGFDAGSVIKGAITDGTMAGAVTQSPLLMGYYAIYAMTMAANGDKVSDFPMDGYWYDSTNMTDPQIAPNLYD
jgi:hypothetical protein